MNEDVSRLKDLYIEGKKADSYFNLKLEELVGDKFEEDEPRQEVPASLLEDLKNLRADTEKYITEWIGSVYKILTDDRDQLEFSNPERSKDINFNLAFKQLPDEARDIQSLINDLYDHNKVLYNILEHKTSNRGGLTSNQVKMGPAEYSPNSRTILFAGKIIRFRKSAVYQPAICNAIFKEPEKLWTLKEFLSEWDSLYDFLDIAKPTDWNKVYDAIKKMNRRVENVTGVSDLFMLSTKSVQLNPKYIKTDQK